MSLDERDKARIANIIRRAREESELESAEGSDEIE